VLFDELDTHATGCQQLDEVPKVAEIPGEPIHAMNHDGVTGSDELEHRLQFRAVCVAS
jgi:hypothetical protein